MSSVTQRIKVAGQPHGGYLPVKSLQKTEYDDGLVLSEENLSPITVGSAVDYLTRYMIIGSDDAFNISLKGAYIAESFGYKGAYEEAFDYLHDLTTLNPDTITAACRLTAFDMYFRNPNHAWEIRPAYMIKPDDATVHNIEVMVNRSLAFFEKNGPVTATEFTFEGGGYTDEVDTGDGDFLTKCGLWDMKVSKDKPKSANTMQILMYYIMGKHSDQDIYKTVDTIGIWNPRLNCSFSIDAKDIDPEVIQTVERNVICYETSETIV